MTTIDEHAPPGVEIYAGEQASELLQSHLPRLKRLIEMESDATYHAPDICFWRLRGRLRDILRRTFAWIDRRCSKRKPPFGDAFLHRLYPSIWFDRWTLHQERQWAWKDAQKLLKQSQLAVAVAENHVVGVCGYKLGGKTGDSREIFEITKMCILPRYRKRGIYRLLRDAVIGLIQQRHGLAPIMSFTRNPSVIRHCQSLQWTNIGLEDYGKLLSRVGRNGPPKELVSDFIGHHWHAFIYDPLAVEKDDE